MAKFNPITLGINVAGSAAVLIVAGYAVNSFFAQETVAPCMTSYPSPTRLTLMNNHGKPMSPIELQGQFGSREWGLLENVEVRRQGGRGSEILQVKLPAGTSSGFQLRAPRGGTGFQWAPNAMENAVGVCVSYRVKLPEDFEFSDAGLLPGVYGGELLDTPDIEGKAGFATRLGWSHDGALAMLTLTPASSSGDPRRFDRAETTLPKGRWVDVMSEVVLNDPGESNGILRLWIDGENKIDARNVDWRGSTGMAISGVTADISYGNVEHPVVAPKDTGLEISPFEMSWQ